MNILLLSTGHPEALVAIIASGQLTVQRQWPGDRTLSTKALTAITELLAEANLELKDIQRIAVDSGPGHFSALRTGIVIGEELVEATGAELVAVSGEVIGELVQQAQTVQPTTVLKPEYT